MTFTPTKKTCKKCGETKPATREFFGSTPKGNLRGVCRTCMNARSKAHAQANPDSVLRRSLKRKKQASDWKPSDDLKMLLFHEQEGCCALCCEPIKEDDVLNAREAQVEHLTPVSKGGANERDNLVLTHRKCNQEKAGKTMPEYVAWRERVGLAPVPFVSSKILALLVATCFDG